MTEAEGWEWVQREALLKGGHMSNRETILHHSDHGAYHQQYAYYPGEPLDVLSKLQPAFGHSPLFAPTASYFSLHTRASYQIITTGRSAVFAALTYVWMNYGYGHCTLPALQHELPDPDGPHAGRKPGLGGVICSPCGTFVPWSRDLSFFFPLVAPLCGRMALNMVRSHFR